MNDTTSQDNDECHLLCRLNTSKDELVFELYDTNNVFVVDKTTFIHYLNYNRMLKQSQILKFVINPNLYIRHSVIFKNESETVNDLRNNNMTVKFIYENDFMLDVDVENKYGLIYIQDNTIIADIDIILDFKNKNKVFKFDFNVSLYPYYVNNNQNIDLLEYIIGMRRENLDTEFTNGNHYDLRKCNMICKHKYHKIITKEYSDAVYIEGHFKDTGKDAYIMKNPMWKVNEVYYVYCSGDKLFTLDETSLEKIREYENTNNIKLTFFINNGYIMCQNNIFIHQIITGCYGNGKGTNVVSVDHIDRNPLNNCYTNLRLADRKMQQENSKGIIEGTKRARNKNSKELPDGITQDMMLKYVVYYKECYNKEKQLFREYFKVEGHPKLDKDWTTTKSNKILISEKLTQANSLVEALKKCITEQDIVTLFATITQDKKEVKSQQLDTSQLLLDKLPKYYNYRIIRDKPHFIYEKVTDGKKNTIKRVVKNKENINKELDEFVEFVNNKLKT
jgi:hypothetical protein